MKLRLPSLSSGFSELIKIFPESLSRSPLYLVRNLFYVINFSHAFSLIDLLYSRYLKLQQNFIVGQNPITNDSTEKTKLKSSFLAGGRGEVRIFAW